MADRSCRLTLSWRPRAEEFAMLLFRLSGGKSDDEMKAEVGKLRDSIERYEASEAAK